MITSKDNEKLKLIRKLAERKHREREGLFVAEGEDLIAAADRARWEPEFVLWAGKDVEPDLLDAVSTLGSGTRVIGVYRKRESVDSAGFQTYLHEVGDPGNVGAIIRTADAFVGGSVALGSGCADAYGPRAVRASMGSIFRVAISEERLTPPGGSVDANDPELAHLALAHPPVAVGVLARAHDLLVCEAIAGVLAAEVALGLLQDLLLAPLTGDGVGRAAHLPPALPPSSLRTVF
jgi:hypothetical protein